MKIAVTGATGFIGSHVADGLLSGGHAVTLLVRDPSRIPFDAARCRVLRGDMLDFNSLSTAFKGADAVVHCAAKVGEWGTREEFKSANIQGMRNLIAACAASGARRVIHLSSASVYGNGDRNLTDTPEEAPFRKTGILYGESKVEAERLLWEAHEKGEIVATAVRPGMVWGPRDQPFLPKLLVSLKKGRLVYPSGGKTLVGLTHVSNVVEIIRLCLAKDVARGRAYNVDDDDRRTFKDVVRALCRRTGYREPRLSAPAPVAKTLALFSEAFFRLIGSQKTPFLTVMGTYIFSYDNDVSVERARRELGYKPEDRFEERLDEYFATLKQA